MINVKDFGAVGDGVTLDTIAVQNALDAGGIVYFPAGTYVCGTLFLRSNGGIELDMGATLLASPNKEDYNSDDFLPENYVYPGECATGAHFIVGYNIENVVVRGAGKIDGNQSAFFAPPPREEPGCYETVTWRPGQMLWICNSKNITFENVELCNSTFWTLFFFGCENVICNGLNVWNHPWTPNGDGISVDSCQNVTISNCLINTGDDCIVVRGACEILKRDVACENVMVTNCVLRTICNAVRIGVGEGTIRRCCFSNISIQDSRTGICMATQYFKGSSVLIEDIMFNNLRIDAQRPFSFHSNAWLDSELGGVEKQIRKISFNHVRGTASNAMIIDGYAPSDIADISFNDVMFEITEPPAGTTYLDESGDFTERLIIIPESIFFIRHADRVSFNSCELRRVGECSNFKYDILSVDSPGLKVFNSDFKGGIKEKSKGTN